MSDTTETVEETVTTPTPDPQQDTTDTAVPDEEQGKAGREAARYRTKLREVEAERDSLTEALSSARKELIQGAIQEFRVRARVAGNGLGVSYGNYGVASTAVADAMPADVDSFFPEGTLDQSALDAHITGLYESRPHLFERAFDRNGLVVESQRGGEWSNPPAGKKGFESAFSPNRDDD